MPRILLTNARMILMPARVGMRRLIVALTCLLGIFAALPAPAETPLRFGVVAFRARMQTVAQWQPMAEYLATALDRPVELNVYTYSELEAAVAANAVDVVLTYPGHYVLLKHRSNLSSPVATQVTLEGQHRLASFGGVIFTRADESGIDNLVDLTGKRIAAVARDAFGAYQMQAFEMLDAGVSLPDANHLLITGPPQDSTVEAVLSGRADVGFIRSGVLEAMAREGKLDPRRIKIIHRQSLPSFPYASSTRLYPEWPVVVLAHVDASVARRLAVALFSLAPESAAARAAGIQGFVIPADYGGVDEMLRRLRVPPYDAPPTITLGDLWHRYAFWMVALGALLLLMAGTALGLWTQNQRVRRSAIQTRHAELRYRTLAAGSFEGIAVTNQGRLVDANERLLQMLGYSRDELIGSSVESLVCPEDRALTLPAIGQEHENQVQQRVIRKDGAIITVQTFGRDIEIDGATIRISAIRDVTARIQMEAEARALLRAVQDEEEKLSALLSSMSDEVWFAGQDKRFILDQSVGTPCPWAGYRGRGDH